MLASKANKDLKLIIQDRPEVAELAKANIAENYKQYANRATAEGHDFFKQNPHSGEGVHYMVSLLLRRGKRLENDIRSDALDLARLVGH
jgi:hypothetical protein